MLGNQIITRKNKHKHLGVILDSKLNFQSQVRETEIKYVSYVSKYVSTDVLDQVYKLYVRPNLDYGDIIYHKFDPDMSQKALSKLSIWRLWLSQVPGKGQAGKKYMRNLNGSLCMTEDGIEDYAILSS